MKEAMNEYLATIESDTQILIEQMEALDMESDAYKDLEYEYNHLSGQGYAVRHLLALGGGDDDN